MIDDNGLTNDPRVHAELQQKSPRKTRLAARGIYYFVGSMLVSLAIAAFVIVVGSLTPKEIKERTDLRREGRLTYTNDVRVGGGRSATVLYTFTYDGESYSGEAFLPRAYLEKVSQYSKIGNFPILFLPRNPSVNHPYDWVGSGSFPIFLYLFIGIIMVQWFVLIRAILQEFQLARNGVVAIGQVTGWSYGRNGGIYVKYEFRDMDDLLSVGRGECPAWRKQDAQICVLYLPDQPDKSRPYPLVFFRAVK